MSRRSSEISNVPLRLLTFLIHRVLECAAPCYNGALKNENPRGRLGGATRLFLCCFRKAISHS